MTRACVAFDLDDTLFLERDYVRSGFAAVGEWAKARLNLDGLAEGAWRLFEEGCRGRVFDMTLLSLGQPADPSVVGSMVRVYRTHRPDIALLPDASRCLEHVRRWHFVGVISDGPVDAQRQKVAALGLAEKVDKVMLTRELGEEFEKPHPRAFELMAEASGADASRCVYVADNPLKDFLAPNRLGWRTVRIVRPGALYCGHDAPGDYRARETVRSLEEAMDRGLLW